ncbi:hypothetical protein Hte_012010 [Hypoxylon texense]
MKFEQTPCLKYLYYRWPRFEYKTKEKELTVQWVVHDGIILQQCVLTNLEDAGVPISFSFRNDEKSMWIRDLDFLDSHNHFNDKYQGYCEDMGPYGYSWILTHKLRYKDNQSTKTDSEDGTNNSPPSNVTTVESKDGPDSVAVVVSIFLDGEALPWTGTNEHSWTKVLKGAKSTGNTMEVITVYRMIPVKDSAVNWKGFLIPAASADVDNILQNTSFSTVSISRTKRFAESYSQSSDNNSKGQKVPKEDDSNPSGVPDNESSPSCHIEYITARQSKPDDMYIKSLLERISEVCKGHLNWLASVEVGKSPGYVANYWVTAKAMAHGGSWQPDNSLTDTAYHVLKILEFTSMYNEEEDLKKQRMRLNMPANHGSSIWRSWMSVLVPPGLMPNKWARTYSVWMIISGFGKL